VFTFLEEVCRSVVQLRHLYWIEVVGSCHIAHISTPVGAILLYRGLQIVAVRNYLRIIGELVRYGADMGPISAH
jgi:hypothetical protein